MRVLIISSFFPPLNNIASLRIGAFDKYLREQGIEVDVITRYYQGDRLKGKNMHIYQDAATGLDSSFIRRQNVWYTNYDANTPEKKRFTRLPPGIRGLYAYFKIDVYAYGWIRYVNEVFETELSQKYDFIIASYGPPVALLAAKKLADRYGIPLIVDYRDIFINEKDSGRHLFLKKQQQAYLLSGAAGLLFVSEGMRDFFIRHATRKLRRLPACIVMNGIDDAIISDAEAGKSPETEKILSLKKKYGLLLLHTGTLYPGQNIEFFIEVMRKLNAGPGKPIALAMVGFADDIRNRKPLEQEHVYFFEKVSGSESVYLQKNADALVLPVWEGRYTGFSGKLLEYMAADNLVFSGPGMQKDVVEFVHGFDNVIQCSSEKDLEQQFKQVIKGELKPEKISPEQEEKLKRSYWIEKLSAFMHDLHKQRYGR